MVPKWKFGRASASNSVQRLWASQAMSTKFRIIHASVTSVEFSKQHFDVIEQVESTIVQMVVKQDKLLIISKTIKKIFFHKSIPVVPVLKKTKPKTVSVSQTFLHQGNFVTPFKFAEPYC